MRCPAPGPRALLLSGLLMGAGPLGAATIYKSVDGDGRVSYSTELPAHGSSRSVEAMRIRTGPEGEASPGAGLNAQVPPPGPAARPGATQGAGRGATQGAAQGQVKQAQQDLIQAKAELEQAKIHGPEDWQADAGDTQVSTPQYEQRVAAARERVRDLEAALERARRPGSGTRQGPPAADRGTSGGQSQSPAGVGPR